jgi:hypothetical protein
MMAVIRMGQNMRLEYVEGQEQLLPGKRCPRCFYPQRHIRKAHVTYHNGTKVFTYSCMDCKQMIALQFEEKPSGQRQAV